MCYRLLPPTAAVFSPKLNFCIPAAWSNFFPASLRHVIHSYAWLSHILTHIHTYTWLTHIHDSLIYIHIQTHSYTYIYMTHSYTWLTHLHNSLIYMRSRSDVIWIIHICDTTYSYQIQVSWAFTLQHIATHCNTLQHTATHCNTKERHGIGANVWSIHARCTYMTRYFLPEISSRYRNKIWRFMDYAGTNASSRMDVRAPILELFSLTSFLNRRIWVPLYWYHNDICNRYLWFCGSDLFIPHLPKLKYSIGKHFHGLFPEKEDSWGLCFWVVSEVAFFGTAKPFWRDY